MAKKSAGEWITLLGAATAAAISIQFHLSFWKVGLITGGAAMGITLIIMGVKAIAGR